MTAHIFRVDEQVVQLSVPVTPDTVLASVAKEVDGKELKVEISRNKTEVKWGNKTIKPFEKMAPGEREFEMQLSRGTRLFKTVPVVIRCEANGSVSSVVVVGQSVPNIEKKRSMGHYYSAEVQEDGSIKVHYRPPVKMTKKD